MSTEPYCFCDLAPLYVLQLLSDAERAWVEGQIEQNPELAVELAELQTTVAAIAHAAPIAPLSPHLKHRLHQELGLAVGSPATAGRTAPRGWGQRRIMSRQTRAWGGGAIAAGLGIALLADNWHWRQATQTTQQELATLQQKIQATQQQMAALEQLNTAIYPLKGTENAPLARGRLIVNPDQQTAVIVTQQLPELPSDQAYRLWAMPAEATQPLYCGQFQPHTDTALTRWTLPTSACGHNVAQMLISVESTSAPLQPAGPLMMKSLI